MINTLLAAELSGVGGTAASKGEVLYDAEVGVYVRREGGFGAYIYVG